MSIEVAAPIQRRPLHNELADRLRHMIVEGELAPGEKLAEKELCEQFGVSRTPLREAMKVLATEGLVLLTPNRGCAVAKLTLADLDEAFPIMGALEALSGELACRHITDAELDRIQELHDRMVVKYEAGALRDYFKLNEQIHQMILDAARNPTLAQMQLSLSGRVRRARYMANMSPARWRKAVDEHEKILETLKARDSKRLAVLLKEHLANKLQTVKDALTE
ncbi:GntR family transcriptional regulator [Pelagibius marinus]|uniref:GntR family transcriptional regulator n=1 Tax=Pelagibius marinus TaxID=2762760 RepID=UPI001872813B|nr:GntR family transcriptional regulator [Pelagibius marinus]